MNRIKAIRSDKTVGHGSGSQIDEWFDDEELAELLESHEIETAEEAIKWAYNFEGIEVEKEVEDECHFFNWQELRMPLE